MGMVSSMVTVPDWPSSTSVTVTVIVCRVLFVMKSSENAFCSSVPLVALTSTT